MTHESTAGYLNGRDCRPDNTSVSADAEGSDRRGFDSRTRTTSPAGRPVSSAPSSLPHLCGFGPPGLELGGFSFLTNNE